MDYQTNGYNNDNNIVNNENDMDTEEPGFSSSLLTFAAVMTFIIMIVGICGNFLTVVALIKCPKVRNVAAAFIISLCVADLLFCALVLPFSGLRFIQGTWTHGDFLCKLIPFIQYGNIGVSLLCIGMITINRYVMIAHHSAYGRIYKKHWIAAMIAFCWLFSYGMQVPTLVGAWGKFDYDPKLGTCSIMTDKHGHSSKTTLFIIAFLIPCLIIIACYTKIFWVVHKSESRLKKHANKQNSIPNNLRVTPPNSNNTENGQNRVSSTLNSDSSISTDVNKYEVQVVQKPSRIKDQRESRAKRNEWRITKMVLAIFLSFVVCYLPITLAKVFDKDVEYPVFHIFSYILLYLSACINPIIYVIMNKQYRKAYKTVIMCEPSKLLALAKTAGGAGGGGGNNSQPEKWKDTGLSNNHSRTMVSQMSGVGDQQNTSLSSSQQQQEKQQSAITFEMKAPKPITTNTNTTNNQNEITTVSVNIKPDYQNNHSNNNLQQLKDKLPHAIEKNNTQNNGIAIQDIQFTQPITTTTTIVPPQLPLTAPPTTIAHFNLIDTITTNPILHPPANLPPTPPLSLLQRTKKEQNINRITLVGGDIILEEEEEVELPTVVEERPEELAAEVAALLPTITTAATATTTTQTTIPTPTPTPRNERIYMNLADHHRRKTPFYGQNINVTPDNNDGSTQKLTKTTNLKL